MSFNKLDPKMQQDFMIRISQILRMKYSYHSSFVKILARDFDIDPRTAKNWLEAKRLPNLMQFIKLSRTIPEIRDLYHHYCQDFNQSEDVSSTPNNAIFEVYSIKIDTIKSHKQFAKIQNLNQRQIWFYKKIVENDKNARANLIVSKWYVGIATAKRDIKTLVDLKLIKFVGSNKNGYYKST